MPSPKILEQFSTYYSQLSTGTNNNFTFSFKDNRRVNKIVVAFLNGTGTTFKSSTTDFSSGFAIAGNAEIVRTSDGMSNISKLSVNFGLLDFSKWQVQQVYVFKTKQKIENISNTCSVSIELKTANANQTTSNFVMGIYDEFMMIGFNENSQYNSFELSGSQP